MSNPPQNFGELDSPPIEMYPHPKMQNANTYFLKKLKILFPKMK